MSGPSADAGCHSLVGILSFSNLFPVHVLRLGLENSSLSRLISSLLLLGVHRIRPCHEGMGNEAGAADDPVDEAVEKVTVEGSKGSKVRANVGLEVEVVQDPKERGVLVRECPRNSLLRPKHRPILRIFPSHAHLDIRRVTFRCEWRNIGMLGRVSISAPRHYHVGRLTASPSPSSASSSDESSSATSKYARPTRSVSMKISLSDKLSTSTICSP